MLRRGSPRLVTYRGEHRDFSAKAIQEQRSIDRQAESAEIKDSCCLAGFEETLSRNGRFKSVEKGSARMCATTATERLGAKTQDESRIRKPVKQE